MRVGILTDFPSQSVQSGPAIHSRLLFDGLSRRGHDVVMMGPDTGRVAEVSDPNAQLYWSFAFPTHPDVRLALPGPTRTLLTPPDLDVIHCQTMTHMTEYAGWIRQMHQVPVLATHTVHIPTHCHLILSDKMLAFEPARRWVDRTAIKLEFDYARRYNQMDCLIVQSRYYVQYWRDRGVTIPIEVVGRPIDPGVFSAPPKDDPFPKDFAAGRRLLVVCRHDREKRLDHLIRIFATRIAPNDPDASLTIIGDGFAHQDLVDQAYATPFAHRIHFPGEVPHDTLVDWYAHADVFTYTSLSETFGNVINEALWCGVPVVALDDEMGVAHQVVDQANGFLVTPNEAGTDDRFAALVLTLLRDRNVARSMSESAANIARQTAHPEVILGRFESIYAEAQRYCRLRVRAPLTDQPRRKQLAAFGARVGNWGKMQAALFALAQATRIGNLGAGMKTSKQHTRGMERSPLLPRRRFRPAATIRREPDQRVTTH